MNEENDVDTITPQRGEATFSSEGIRNFAARSHLKTRKWTLGETRGRVQYRGLWPRGRWAPARRDAAGPQETAAGRGDRAGTRDDADRLIRDITNPGHSDEQWMGSRGQSVGRAARRMQVPALRCLILEPASKVSVVNHRQRRTAFASDTGRSASEAGTALHAPEAVVLRSRTKTSQKAPRAYEGIGLTGPE